MGDLTEAQIAFTSDFFEVDVAGYGDGAQALQKTSGPPPAKGAGKDDGSDGTTDNKGKPKGNGWRKVNILVTVIDFNGGPMGGHELILEFKAPGAEKIDAGGPMTGGGMTFSNVWLQPEGIVRVIAISTGEAMLVPEGTANYKLPASGPLKIKAVQQKREVQVSAKSSEEAGEKVGAKGTVGIDYKVVKAEGEVSGESESKKGSEVTYAYVVTLAKPVFDLTL